ncbi:hypothetical protein TNCV_1232891, partial [Trichonephila clavipes]
FNSPCSMTYPFWLHLQFDSLCIKDDIMCQKFYKVLKTGGDSLKTAPAEWLCGESCSVRMTIVYPCMEMSCPAILISTYFMEIFSHRSATRNMLIAEDIRIVQTRLKNEDSYSQMCNRCQRGES